MANNISVSIGDALMADIRQLIGDRAYSKGGLADHGTNHENVLTAAAVAYSVGGVMYSKAAQTEIDLSALGVIDESGTTKAIVAQSAGTTRCYLLVLNSAGTIKIVQITGVLPASSSSDCPGCPAGYAPFGAVKIVNGTASAFTFGTTSKTTAGITPTYTDLAIAPESL